MLWVLGCSTTHVRRCAHNKYLYTICGLLLLWQQVQASSIHLLQELLQAAIDLKPRAIWLSFGDWESLATPIKKAGIMIICQVQHLEQVEPALKAGADVIVGQVLPQASSSCSHS